MAQLRFRKRRRLKRKEIEKLAEDLKSILGVDVFSPEHTVDVASGREFDVLYVNGVILALIIKQKPFLTVRGLLKYKPERKYVTVDMGAVRFVCDGADVMAPGIIDADPSIEVGEMVWVRDEKNHQPLAIGEAIMNGKEMAELEKGKAVKSLHWVGDPLWKFGD